MVVKGGRIQFSVGTLLENSPAQWAPEADLEAAGGGLRTRTVVMPKMVVQEAYTEQLWGTSHDE